MEAQELLAGRYRLDHIAGNGAMALVFRAHDTVLDRTVAIKYLQFAHRRRPAVLERFAREARAAAKIVSPYVVSVYDVGEGDERPFIVMEFVDGKSLDEILRDGPPPLPTALHYGEQAARGLAAAHEHGIVHRDVKPANLVVDENGWLRITDFGLAHGPDDDGEAEIPGALVGSAFYVPPEQARDGGATPASDCYGLGVVLYEMLSGALPFDGKTALTIAFAHLAAPPKPLAQAAPGVPADVCELVDALLDKEPSRRPADAAAIADRLAAAAQRERERGV